jgi:NitT/TauT family transport system substrate-binding protein
LIGEAPRSAACSGANGSSHRSVDPIWPTARCVEGAERVNNVSSSTLTRRTFLGTAALGAAAAGAGFAFPRPAIAQAVQVTYTLSWLPTGQYAYLYAARQLGYFKKRGIDLDISRGFGSMAANQAVSVGKFQMGSAQAGANLLGIIRGLDLRLVGTHGYDATLGILTLKSTSIKTPKDLEGRTIGVAAAGGDTVFLPAYCKLAGIDFDKLKIVQIDSKILEQSAMSGVVEAIVMTGLSSIPNFASEDVPITVFPFSKAGLPFYWLNTITSSDFLEKNKELVDHVQAGINEGIKFMLLNPQEALDRHLKEHEELALGKNGKLYVELGMHMTRSIMMAPESIEHGVGYTDLQKIGDQAKIVKQYAAKPTDPDPPAAEAYCRNDQAGQVTLTPAEWDEVKSSTSKYRELLGI